MSISINSYRSNYSAYNQDDTTTNRRAGKPPKSEQQAADSITFSLEALSYMSQQQAGGATVTEDAVSEKSEISIDQKKKMLTNLQNRLSESTTSGSVTDSDSSKAAEALASLSETLSGFNADTASDEEVSELFDQVAETMDSMRKSAGGMPPMKPGMNGFPPPIMNAEETSGGDESQALTADDMKTMLAELQEKLTGLGEDSELPPGLAEALTAVREELEGFDAGTASDEEVSSLFEEVGQTLAQSRPVPPADGSGGGVPRELMAMGGIMPPFAWNISASDTSDGAATEEASAAGEQTGTTTATDLADLLSALQAKLETLDTNTSFPGGLAEVLQSLSDRLSSSNSNQSQNS